MTFERPSRSARSRPYGPDRRPLGEVAEIGKPIVAIVLDCEARVLNKSTGFVQLGERAVIKLEAYPFARYGTLSGQVVEVFS